MIVDKATLRFVEKFKQEAEALPDETLPDLLKKKIDPITRLKILVNKYGREWLAWEAPETLWQTIKVDFDIPDIEKNDLYREEKDQIMALKASILTDGPWQDHNVFEKIGNAFNGNAVNFQASQPLSPAQCVYTVEILKAITSEEEFGTDVKKYIAVSFHERGYVIVYDGLEFAQEELDKLGNQDFNLKDKVQKAWNKYKDKDIVPQDPEEGPTAIDIQLNRLFKIKNFLKDRRNYGL